jgi:uncharacterized protein YjiS (DUF1127 family)
LEAIMFAIYSLFWSALFGAQRKLARFARAIRNRRAATALAGLDDHMLADIGITRSDLRDAYAEPLWHDPTDILVGRATERRHARQRSVLATPASERQPSWLGCETLICR